jgi:DNA-binding NtrC family response regulator
MILLVTPNSRGQECATALSEATGIEVVVAESLQRATTLLRTNEYVAVVLDQYLLETEADQTSTLMKHLGNAIPVQVNLAVSRMERLVREVQAAVQRRKREQVIARRAAQERLQSELSGTVTALLLHCDLAMAVPGLPPATVDKLQAARELVNKLRTQLHSEISRT